MPERDGIHFVRYGTAVSRSALNFPSSPSGALTIELLLRPHTPWTRGTPLAFYNPSSGTSFEIHQVYADLLLVSVLHDRRSEIPSTSLRLPDIFLKPEFLLTIASNGQHTFVYVNGQFVATTSNLALSRADLSGQVILGNSPVRNHQWAGSVEALAVYGEFFNPEIIRSRSAEWMSGVTPQVKAPDMPVALYLFREREGRVIHDAGASGADLDIPAKYETMDQIRFETPASERQDGNYKDDAIFNVFGFVPLGLIAALFFTRFLRRVPAAVCAIATGFTVSLAIEYLQSFLPTRFSGTTDLITNTLGTALGVLICYLVLRVIPNNNRVEQLSAQPG
jgi:VanZ family protein